MHEPVRILVCLRYGIGDLVMELPALDLLRAAFPKAVITGVGAAPAIELLEGDERVDKLIAVQKFGFTHWGDWGSGQARRLLDEWLDAEAFDLVLDPSHAVIAVGEAIWRRDVAIRDSGRELSVDALRAGANGPEALRRAIAGGWGLVGDELWVPTVRQAPLERALRDRIASVPHPRIGISAVASSPLKRWAPERFAELMERMNRAYGSGFLVFTGPEPVPEAIAEALQTLPGLHIGALHLRQVASILAHCDALVCNDTGVMHLSAAVGTSPIAVFGPTDSNLYLPPGGSAAGPGVPDCPVRLRDTFGPPQCVVQGRCLNESAPPEGCVGRVPIERVEGAVAAVLAGRGGTHSQNW